jgi:hypothetical protein
MDFRTMALFIALGTGVPIIPIFLFSAPGNTRLMVI